MKLNQYSFSSESELIEKIDEIQKREKRKSRSEVIVLLLESAIKERDRQKNKRIRAKCQPDTELV